MIELSKENFEELVLANPGLVAVDYWSPKCEPCLELMPSFIELAGRFQDVTFGKVNIVENRRLAIGQKVMGLPTIVFYKNGVRLGELTKDFSIEDVEALLLELLAEI